MNKIVVVEDEHDYRASICTTIEQIDNFECIGDYSNYEDFFDDLYKGIEPDFILSDINLPGMSGLEAIMKLQKEYSSIQIIVLTVFNDEQKIFNALKAGAISYLLKSDVSSNIENILEVVSLGGAYMSPSIAMHVSTYFKNKSSNNIIEGLGPREYEVIDRLVMGMKYKEIAEELYLSIDTIRYHIKNIYRKLHINSRDEIVKMFKKL